MSRKKQPIKLNLAQAVELAELVVQDKPNGFRYSHKYRDLWPDQYDPDDHADCAYFLGEQLQHPGCMVGEMIWRKGYSFSDMVALSVNEDEYTLNECSVMNLADEGIIKPQDDKVLKFLSIIQGRQDGGETWRKALREAKKELGWRDRPVDKLVPAKSETSTVKAIK